MIRLELTDQETDVVSHALKMLIGLASATDIEGVVATNVLDYIENTRG